MQVDFASKLRSTCDRCTLLKVRCDKQKPQCERCKGVGAPCAYSLRRWKGRAAAKSVSSRSTASVESSSGSSGAARPSVVPAVATEPWAPSDAFGLHTRDLGTAVEFQDAPMGMGLQWDGLLPGADGLGLAGWYSAFMEVDREGKEDVTTTQDQVAGSWRVTPSPAPTPATRLSHMGSALDSMASASSPDTSHSASSGTESPESCYGSVTRSCQCSTLVFQLLQDMYHADPLSPYRLIPPGGDDNGSDSLALSSAGPTPRATAPRRPRSDDMVKVNREAVQHMEQLLSCDCVDCVRDPTLFFLVTALLSKLLAWYRAVFSLVRRQSDASPESEVGSGSSDADEGAAAAVDLAFAVPIQVEGFHLDFGSEQRMKAQFLLCEVRRLGQVLDLFGARAVSCMPTPYLAAPPGSLPIPAVHQFLTTSHSRLVTTVKEYCIS